MGANSQNGLNGQAGRFGLALTNVIKLGGFVAAMNELLIRETTDGRRLAIIGLMLAGTQFLESLARGIFGK